MKMEDIKIDTYEDVEVNDKIKTGESNLGTVIEDPDKDMYSEYQAVKNKRKSSCLIDIVIQS